MAVIGFAQWVVLKQQFSQAGWWILTTTVGGAVGGAVGMHVIQPMHRIVIGAVFGAVVGCAQWIVLRQQYRRAGWWILAMTVGGAVGGALGWTVGRTVAGGVVREVSDVIAAVTEDWSWFDDFGKVVSAMSWAVVGTVAGAVTEAIQVGC
jgi:hypothetical protein